MPISNDGQALKVFISYSRRDTTIADALLAALTSRGFQVLIDRRSLPFGERWQAELAELIRKSNTVVWLISDASIKSKWVNWELDEVAKRGKRLVPVLATDTPRGELPRQLGEINILPSEGIYDPARDLDSLVQVLNTDFKWLKEAGRIADRAHEWTSSGKNASFLLRSAGLTGAERWVERRPAKAPPIAQDALDLLLASRQSAIKRQRMLVTLLAATGLVFVGIAAAAISQLYRVETEKWLSNAQLMSRRQPTEAFLALAAVKDRWLGDASSMARLSPQLIGARLTLARHALSDSVHGARWGTGGTYTAASSSGRAYLWAADNSLIAEVPPRLVSTATEVNGFGQSRPVPLSRAWTAAAGTILATRDWRGCLRIFETAKLQGISALDPAAQTCLNASALNDGEDYIPAGVREDGAPVLLRDGAVHVNGRTMDLSEFAGNRPVYVDADMQDRVFVALEDKTFLILQQGAAAMALREQVSYGTCGAGTHWSAGEDGGLTFISEKGNTFLKLFGKSPWLVSRGCSLYLDGEGDLYRLDNPTSPIRKGIAESWQYNGNARSTAFSGSDRYFAISSNDGSIRVHDLANDTAFELLGHTQRIFEMAFDDADTRLVTSSLDQTLRIFSLTETIVRNAGQFPDAAEVYSATAGGGVASKAEFDYAAIWREPPVEPHEVPGLPSGAQVPIRQDWKIGSRYVVADGDTQVVAVCSEAACPDTSIVRKFKIDFTGSGGTVKARASPEGEFVAVVEDGRALHFIDLRRAGSAPLLSFAEGEIKSVAFDAREKLLYMLRGDQLLALPFGPKELALRLGEAVTMCLTDEERSRLSDGSGWLKPGRDDVCSRRSR